YEGGDSGAREPSSMARDRRWRTEMWAKWAVPDSNRRPPACKGETRLVVVQAHLQRRARGQPLASADSHRHGKEGVPGSGVGSGSGTLPRRVIPPETPLLTVRGLTRSFAGREVVRSLNLVLG